MKVMVCLKQVPHQDARLDVNADGTWIQEDNIKFEINSYDTYAIEEALRLKDEGDAEVVVVSIGPDRVTQALRTALGMGADRAIHVNDDGATGADALGAAKILAAIAKEEGPDIIFAGLMSEDDNASAVPPMVAALLDFPSATGVTATDMSDSSVKVERELEGGALEVVELPKPCLLAIQSGANQVRYASLKGIMQAKKKPVDVKTLADLGLADSASSAQNKTTINKIYVPPKSDTAEILEGSTGEVVGQLVTKIKELGLL
ncbi:MAG: electron transfer flavoprotein subunit beta [Deltaproteobacteria bacterium]|nr:electron transfer flavoprotein subunit beta [Deltaproteobacteria bacterium]